MMENTLKEYISQPLATVMGRQLTAAIYYDASSADYLITNGKGIDIISSQLELVFDLSFSIYISWATVKGWMQYSLAAAVKPFSNYIESFTASPDYWQKRIGKRLTQIEVFGYLDEEVITTISDTGEQLVQHFYNVPYMLVLHFEGQILAVTNSYLERNFQPKLPFGDDVWIMFEATDITACIEHMKFNNLQIGQSAFQ